MALLNDSVCEMISDSSLSDWVVIGSGGFGQVYKARHCMWCCDVAIKLLHHDDGWAVNKIQTAAFNAPSLFGDFIEPSGPG